MKYHNYFVYILTNKAKTVLYIGVTNNLERRLYEHETNSGNKFKFTSKYNCVYLIYYEHFSNINQAIARETELKKWRREKKNNLIASMNSEWRFLNEEIKERFFEK
jgi:putative endonuclease